MKHHPSTICIFSDKKTWTVNQTRNSRNDQYLASCVEEVPPINTTKHLASVMMLGDVGSDGQRMPCPHSDSRGEPRSALTST